MRLSFLALCLAAGLLAGPSARADQIRNPNAVFAGLDKITGRIISFDVAIDETVQFGTLQITPRVCLTRPQTENPLTEGFVEVDDVESAKTAKRIFSGWMFAASPGLHGVEHPVYDIWLKDCKGGKDVIASPAPGTPAATPPNAQSSPTPGKKPRILKPQEPEEPKVEAPSSSAESAPPAEPVDMVRRRQGPRRCRRRSRSARLRGRAPTPARSPPRQSRRRSRSPNRRRRPSRRRPSRRRSRSREPPSRAAASRTCATSSETRRLAPPPTASLA